MSNVIIIAEAGVNHNGSIELAKKLVDVAAEAGADYVKFQTFKADKIASRRASKAEYQRKTTDASESQLQMLRKLELSDNDHLVLIEYCKQKGIAFLSTPFDLESIDLLRQLGITLGKIPSGEITNLQFLRKMARSFDQLVMSTGMAELNEIQDAIIALEGEGFDRSRLTILHCNSEYPTPFADVNLRAMDTIRDQFQVAVGYSDHTTGIEVPIAAVALGAVLIEKHFTLDRSMEGPDHRASLEPRELVHMVASIRHIEQALGTGIKTASASELKNKEIARKSLVAARDLPAGHVLQEEDLESKRPGSGISPMKLPQLLGKRLVIAVRADEFFTYEHFA